MNKVSQISFSPATLETLAVWTDAKSIRTNAAGYVEWIDSMGRKYMDVIADFTYEEQHEIENAKIYSELFRLLLALRTDLLTFIPENSK